MPSIAFSTIKGGVGKTTLSVHVAAGLADLGLRVLLLDLDPQAHASMVLGLDAGDRPCVADAFGPRPRYTLDQIVVPSPKRPSLFIAPAALRMSALERELYQWGHRLEAIGRALRTLSWTPDVVVADTPPNLGAFTEAVLRYCDVVAAPVPTGAFALQGLAEIEAAFQDVREGNGTLVAVVNMLDRRTLATNAAMEDAFGDLKMPVLKARIPRAEALNQAELGFELVYDTNPSAPVVEDLRALTLEMGELAGIEGLKRARARTA